MRPKFLYCAIVTAMLGLPAQNFAFTANSITFQVIQSEMSFDNSTIESAAIVKGDDGKANVQVQLKSSVINKFKKMTKASVGKKVNLVFNEKIISSPVIQSELGGSFLITGFTDEDAEMFVKSISQSG